THANSSSGAFSVTTQADGQAGGREQPELRALLDTVKRIAALTPPALLLELIADAATRLLGFETGGFRLVEGDDLVVAGQCGDSVMGRPRLKIGESPAGPVAASGAVLIVEGPRND